MYSTVHTGPSRSYHNQRAVRIENQPFSYTNGYSASESKIYNRNSVVFDDDSNSSYTNTSSTSGVVSASQATPTFQLVRKASIRESPGRQVVQSNSPFRIDIYSVGVLMHSKITGQVFDPEQVKIEAEAPTGRIIRMNGDGHYSAQFTSDEIGRWRVSMYYRNKFMDGCPVDVCDPSQVRVRDLRGGHMGKMQSFEVDCTGAGLGELEVEMTHKGKRVTSFVKETSTPKLYKVSYTPYDPGPYEVNVLFNKAEIRNSDFHSTDPEERQRRAVFNTTVQKEGGIITIDASCEWEVDYVTGGPFVVHVTDSSNIEVYGMKDGTVCSNPELIADCTKVGEGTITADVTYNGVRCPCKVRTDKPAIYRVSFKPRGPGVYKIWMNYDGAPVKGSPFIQEIAELGSPLAYGEGLQKGVPGTTQTFTVDPRGHPGHITAQVEGPFQNVPCHMTPQDDGTVLASYVPRETGPHNVDIRVDGKPIEGSPYKPYIVDPSKVRMSGDWGGNKGVIPLHVNKEKMMPFDASNAGLGELSAEVRGPSGRIPVAIDARNDGRHTVLFTPREEGKHLVDVKWGGFPLVTSPYEGYAVRDPEPMLPDVSDLILPQRMQQAQSAPPQPPVEEKDIIPLTVGQEAQLPFDTADTGPGTMSAQVRGPHNKHVPVSVVERSPGKPVVSFTPQEEGKHLIDVDWNGTPLSSSPFIGFASKEPNNNVYQSPSVLPMPSNRVKDEDKEIIPLKVNKTKQIPFDVSKAGPGNLTARVRGPTHAVPHTVQDTGDGKPTLAFTPQEEGKHYIDVDWNGDPLPQSPLLGFATKDLEPLPSPRPTSPPVLPVPHPINRVKDEDKDIIPLKVNQTKMIPFDVSKAGPGNLTARVRGPTHAVPHTVQDTGDGKPTLSFTPQEEGKHYIDVDWNGEPLPQSPLLGFATKDLEPNGYPSGAPPVFLAGTSPSSDPGSQEKDIIPLKVNKEKALPFDATRAGPGKLSGEVRGPSHSIPVSVEDRKDGKPKLFFTPEEEGKHTIDVNWNGRPIPQSPLLGYAAPDDTPRYLGPPPVYLAGYNPKGGKPYDREKDIIPLKVNHSKQLPFDATEAPPGTMTAAVRGPSRQIPVSVEDKKIGKPTLNFTPEEEGKHLIDVDWNGSPIPNSPFVGYATRDPQPVLITHTPVSSRPPSDVGDPDVSFRSSLHSIPQEPERVRVLPPGPKAAPVKVILSGRGLKEAEVNKPAVFKVDGTQAPLGKPTAHLEGVKTDIPVHVDPQRPQVSKCTYVPKVPGAYKLHVKWNDQPLRGSPFKVNVRAPAKQPPRGIVSLPPRAAPARPGEDVSLTIDHPDHRRRFSSVSQPSGQLTVQCTDPKGSALPCRFLDNLDGTRTLKFNPPGPGRHRVDIKQDGDHIMGSPYYVDVTDVPKGRVHVWGPGIQPKGVLQEFQSHFFVDTKGAGAGELRVRIMGPKGAFKVKMLQANDSKKRYQCFYDPIEPGVYTVYVEWSGKHVDDSPFTVYLASSHQELLMMGDDRDSTRGGPLSNGSPREGGGHDFLY